MTHRFAIAAATVALIFSSHITPANAASVTIRDEAFGLPHICADTDAAASRQQGFEDVRDRAGQLLFVANMARGTLHRALGGLGVEIDADVETRKTGYSRDEYNQMFANLPADAKALLLAYCDGVNAALNEMMLPTPTIEPPLELLLFRQSSVAGDANLFGNADELTQGEGLDPYYDAPGGAGAYTASGSQFTPEVALSIAVLQIRNFGFEEWDEVGMSADLANLTNTYGLTIGPQLWDDRHWKNDPLAPVSVPDPRNPGFGGPLAMLTSNVETVLADAADAIDNCAPECTQISGRMPDHSKALEPWKKAGQYREEIGRKWGAWPALGSYGMVVSAARSATGNPWVGGFPQTGIQVPSIMHYTELRGATIKGNGMAFVGSPYVLVGQTDSVAYTTTTAHLKISDTYIETLVNTDIDLFRYDHHGLTAEMSKRIELVEPSGGGSAIEVPVFRTNKTCSSNGCNGGTRPVLAFSGDFSGAVDSATSTSITDADAGLTPAALLGGYVAITDGAGAGQMRSISGNTATTISVGTAWTTLPDDTSAWVAVASGGEITAVTRDSSLWLGEAEAATGFSRYQQASSVEDVRDALRFIPSTHNFLAADNQAFNGVGTSGGTGNIYYGASGFHRVRQTNTLDSRLPLDGAGPEAFAVVSGVVDSAGASSLTDATAFPGGTFTAAAVNFTYDNPDDNGVEYIVRITAGDGMAQTRRIVSNTNDTLTLEHPWGTVPTTGDTYAVYRLWATPEAMNPSEGCTASWNNKQSRATDSMLDNNGRNQRVDVILEQLSLDNTISRDDLRYLNKFVAGVTDPGVAGRYLIGRVQTALTAYGDCGTLDNQLAAFTGFPVRGREFMNPLLVPPAGEPFASAAASSGADYIKDFATQLAGSIYNGEYGFAGVTGLTGDAAIGWILHAIDSAEGDVTGSYSQQFISDYFNGADWKQVVRDSFCTYVVAHPTYGTKNRTMSDYVHPLAALPCDAETPDCITPIEFDSTPYGNRGIWEQIVEVGPTVKGEFIFPLGQSGFIGGVVSNLTAAAVKQSLHTSTLQPVWRDWRLVPMLDVCDDVTLGGDEDGDVDGDGVSDAYERWYYGNTTSGAGSDTDSDGASLSTEWRWGSDPTVSDTDQDTVSDGNDVAPQDRLCVRGTLTKLSLSDKADPGKDKVSAKWTVPLNVCVGSDYATPCATNGDCEVAGRCQRLRFDPQRDSVRVVAADDTPVLDADIPRSDSFWKNSKGTKFSYSDKEGVNGPVTKIKVSANEKKGVVQIQIQAKNFDVATPVDGAAGVVGLSIGNRCFREVAISCTTGEGKLSCIAE